MKSQTQLLLFILLGASGCTNASTDVEAVVDILEIVNERSRSTNVSEFITRSAEIPISSIPGHSANAACPIPENTDIGQFSVISNVMRDGIVSFVESWNQEWELLFLCNDSGRDNLEVSLLISKSQSSDGLSGIATIEGEVQGGRGKSCDVSVEVDYSPATGEVLSARGSVCGKDVAADATLFVVPGFADEHLVEAP